MESIIDSGSQIVVMDKTIAVDLGLQWDPTVLVHLQDVNGGLQATKGLARNVPFSFNDITVYLQVHIQDACPFHVLIGRPFDVLTASVVSNFTNGYQEITITDPASGKKTTMGTRLRGKKQVKFVEPKEEKKANF